MDEHIILFFLFLIVGLIFRTGRAAPFVSGFASLPSSERKKWDESKLSKFVGNILISVSVLYILAYFVSSVFPSVRACIFEYSNTLAVVIGMAGVVFVNVSKRYKK